MAKNVELSLKVYGSYTQQYTESLNNSIHNANAMEQSPSWEANTYSASQEISCILWNRIFIIAITSARHLPLSFGQINPVHATPFHFLNTYFNIILPSTPRSSKWFPSIRPPPQNRVFTSPVVHVTHMPLPSHSSGFYHSNNVWWGVENLLHNAYPN